MAKPNIQAMRGEVGSIIRTHELREIFPKFGETISKTDGALFFCFRRKNLRSLVLTFVASVGIHRTFMYQIIMQHLTSF